MPRTKQFDQTNILRKAMECFWKKGFHATSMQDLVDHLGINRASLYNAFPGGKEQLFLEAFQMYRSEFGPNPAQARQALQEKTVQAFFIDLFQQELTQIYLDEDQKGCFITNTVCELSNQAPEVRQLLSINMENAVQFFTQVVKLGQKRGEIPPDHSAKAIAKHIFIFLNGLKAIAKINQDIDSLRQTIEVELSYLFNG